MKNFYFMLLPSHNSALRAPLELAPHYVMLHIRKDADGYIATRWFIPRVYSPLRYRKLHWSFLHPRLSACSPLLIALYFISMVLLTLFYLFQWCCHCTRLLHAFQSFTGASDPTGSCVIWHVAIAQGFLKWTHWLSVNIRTLWNRVSPRRHGWHYGIPTLRKSEIFLYGVTKIKPLRGFFRYNVDNHKIFWHSCYWMFVSF